ncbi:cupin domain-containing protein [Arthrobacter sp. NEB 688]|uniref:cupin domain-containing protein n=1 Tax=Arthrobacter sp. NEB 688 TaxID=904039 RepID=UPI0015631250|nr:cupin domain-containing protein [Arthrobacter sp. NEB 688]QKE85096.1 cupin domain-containing protein [Arthrobacter sp. NEB 688]
MATPTAPRPHATFDAAARQDKPWGHEVVFAGGTHGYVGKLLTVRAEHALSLQFHRFKDETIHVVSGRATLEHYAEDTRSATRSLSPGDTVHLPAGVRHRVRAVTDVLLVEASTCAPGWADDVVRLDDDYGRSGTTAR